MLQSVAPRPWAKRTLAWYILETTGYLEFMSGIVTETTNAQDFLRWAGIERDAEVETDDPTALRALAAKPWEDIVVEEPRVPEFPFAVPIEVVLQLEFFDWESGVARGSMQHVTMFAPDFYEDIQGSHGKSWLELNLSGLSFPLAMIEMLAPNAVAPPNDLFATPIKSETRTGGPGRRRTHNWDGAMFYLIGEAERNAIAPDPEAHGAQADIAKLMADWFAEHGAAVPANSQLQAKAKLVLEHIRAANPKPS